SSLLLILFPLSSYLSPTCSSSYFCFFFPAPSPTEIYTLSLHDALPIWVTSGNSSSTFRWIRAARNAKPSRSLSTCGSSQRSGSRSEEHTSELQSRENLVCRLLLEKKKTKKRELHTYK